MAEGGSTVPVGDKQSQDDSEDNLSDPIVVLVAGKIGSGKSTALNNLFDLTLDARSSPTPVTMDVQKKIVQKNERFFRVVDTPGLGGRRITTEAVVEKMVEAVKDPNFVLVYCLPVKPSDTLTETDRAIVRTIQVSFGRHVWNKCVLLLTFSDIARRELGTDQAYIPYLQGHIEAFHRILTSGGAKLSEIKLVFEVTRAQLEDYSSGKVVAIPVMNAKDSVGLAISPGIDTSWTKLALDKIMKASRIPRPSEEKPGCYGAFQKGLHFTWQVIKNPRSNLSKVSEKVQHLFQEPSEKHDSDPKSS